MDDAPVPMSHRRHYARYGLVETASGPPDPVVRFHTEFKPKPKIGRARAMLNKVLAAAGLDRGTHGR